MARVEYKSELQMRTQVKMIIDDGGEGVILRKRGSLYDNGRNSSLIKLKVLSNNKNILFVYLFLLGLSRRSRRSSN